MIFKYAFVARAYAMISLPGWMSLFLRWLPRQLHSCEYTDSDKTRILVNMPEVPRTSIKISESTNH